MGSIRLDKFLAEEGIGSRAEVKKMIRSGRIRVNGITAGRGEEKVDPDRDEIYSDHDRVLRAVIPVLMLNKPSGVVSATKDAHLRTVIDLIDEPWAGKLFPVGRLDRDTEGLLLLTDDGMLGHELLSPKKHVKKTYYAVVSGAPDPALIERFREGLEIGEKRKTLPSELSFFSRDTCTYDSIRPQDLDRCMEDMCCAAVTITEGKFHQVKRMFQAVGRELYYLKRIAMGNLFLDPALPLGEYRPLTQEELQLLK